MTAEEAGPLAQGPASSEKATPGHVGGDQPVQQGALGRVDCFGTRAVRDDFGLGEDGDRACPSCVVPSQSGDLFVVWEP